MLKPLGGCAVYVVDKATTHKDSRVLTLTLKPCSLLRLTAGLKCLCENFKFVASAAKAVLILRQLRHG